MARTRKMTQDQIRAELKQFSEITYKTYGSDSYSAGFFEAMFSWLLADASAKVQQEQMAFVRAKIADLAAGNR